MSLDLSKFRNQTKPLQSQQEPQPIQDAVSKVIKPIKLSFPINAGAVATSKQVIPQKSDSKFGINIPRTITAWNADGTSKDINLNDKQYEFAQYIANGISCVLIGAAGTGKTTCTQAGIAALMNTGNVLVIKDTSHKYLSAGTPGILITSFTRRAVSNIKRQMPADLSANTITIHKALEYGPVFSEVTDELTLKVRIKREFLPKRTILNRLCQNVRTVIIDEASMLSVELFEKLREALHPNTQFIFIGDLNQLPPVMGNAILGYKLLELPVIELTEVYRQALESPIISLAHRVLSGKPIMTTGELYSFNKPQQLQIITYPKSLDSELAMIEAVKMFYDAYNSGAYNPETDVILCPQATDKTESMRFNTTQINKYLANHIAKREGRVTYEIIASFQKLYFSINDLVIYDKQDARIIDIKPNPSYVGQSYQQESKHLDYFGFNHDTHKAALANSDIDLDKLIDLATNSDSEEIKQQASHIITLEIIDSHSDLNAIIDLKSVGELRNLDLGYAMTIHKSQGSEWRKVFLLLHKSHNVMLSRELLYTAITRAREHLVILCEKDSFVRGITKQRIKGNTLAEKAEYFKGKIAQDALEAASN